jgi:hypothetical protein
MSNKPIMPGIGYRIFENEFAIGLLFEQSELVASDEAA